MVGTWSNSKNAKILTLLAVGLLTLDFTFISSSGWARIFWNVLGYIFLWRIYKVSNLTAKDIGLVRKDLKSGIKYGAAISGIIIFGFILVFLIHESTFQDPRYNQSISTAFYAALVLLPLKTVFFEELTFRGIFPGLTLNLNLSRNIATLVSSGAYGAWHFVHIQNVIAGDVRAPKLVVILITFLVTSIAGVIFCELRWRSNSLIAPILVHLTINSSSIIFSSLSWN